MTVGRVAKLDTPTPPLTLAGHGELTIAGHVEATPPVTRAGPPRERSPIASSPDSIEPARAALARQQAAVVKLEADATRAAKPVARLLDQLKAATADLQKAETELAASDAQRANALARAAREGTDAPVLSAAGTGAAEIVVSRARVMTTLRLALDECREDQARAAAALEAAQTKFDDLILSVALDEHAALLKIWHARRDALFDVEEKVLGLEDAISVHGRALQEKTGDLKWLQRREGIGQPWAGVPFREIGPREIYAAASRWVSVFAQLKSDPNASF
jgi:hypothetical protein